MKSNEKELLKEKRQIKYQRKVFVLWKEKKNLKPQRPSFLVGNWNDSAKLYVNSLENQMDYLLEK